MKRNRFGLSSDIPDSVAREVRKQCGYGCVVCGCAFYDYEHWNPEFKDAEEHLASGITLCCPGCHRKKGGLLSQATYEKHIANPKALEDGFAWTDWDKGFTPEIVLGTVRYLGGTTLIRIGEQPVLGFEAPEAAGAPPRLIARFFDRGAREVFRIDNNRCFGNPDAFDIESKKVLQPPGWRWTARSEMGKVDLVVDLQPPDRIVISRLAWHLGPIRLIANNRGVQVKHLTKNQILVRGGGTIQGLKEPKCFLTVTTEMRLDANQLPVPHVNYSVSHCKFDSCGEISMSADAEL